MIKELISDLAYDKIQLSQALTRAKIIATKVKNEIFRKWLNNELEGYSIDDTFLPEYRKITCEIKLRFELDNVGERNISVTIPSTQKELYDAAQFHRVLEPISIIEKNIIELSSTEGYIDLGRPWASALLDLLGNTNQKVKRRLVGGYKEVGKSQFQNIVELTKQKLLGTLLELDDEFPNLLNEFNMTKDNKEKIQNIITNNIYGNNNPVNIAAGQNVEQKDISNTITQEDYTHLEELGVEKHSINELKQIVQAHNHNKPILKTHLIKWLSEVSAHVTAISLAHNIPAITEFVSKLF